MIKLVGTDSAGIATPELVLLDESDRPTPVLIGLVVAELAFDILVAYAAYRFFKGRS